MSEFGTLPFEVNITYELADIRDIEGNLASGEKQFENIYQINFKLKVREEEYSHKILAQFSKNKPIKICLNQNSIKFVFEDLVNAQKLSISSNLLSQMIVIYSGGDLIFNMKDDVVGMVKGGFDYHSTRQSFFGKNLNGMKQDRVFKGSTLRGYNYRHIFCSSLQSMATNMLNQLNDNKWGGKNVDSLIKGSKKETFDDALIRDIANLVTDEAMKKRLENDKVTGEWLVYKKEEANLHLLTLAVHKESDEDIRSRLGGVIMKSK